MSRLSGHLPGRRPPTAGGRLFVDEHGLASWRPPGGHPGLVNVERWSAGERLVWLRLTGHRSAPRFDLLLPRRAFDDDSWRRLRAWLLWLQRGAGDR
ncbi:MAG: hypothetical protein AB7L76_17550 [Burkholderiaceae bacterium]